MNRRWLTTVLTVTVSFCWAFAAIAGVVSNRFVPIEVITPVMLTVVGFYMTRKETNGNGKDHR